MFKKAPEKEIPLQEEAMTFLEKGAHFKGTLSYEGTVRVDGEVEGDIATQGTLIIGERGIINADVTVGTLIVGGRVNGNIHAAQKVQLLSKSVVTGSLTTPTLIIEDGAILNGICEMKRVVEPLLNSERSERALLA